MKRLFIAALFATGVGSVLVSCNNGNYDADPKTDNSAYKNPLDPSSGVHVYIGTIKANVSTNNGLGKDILFVNAVHKIDSNNIHVITATQFDDPIFNGDLEIFYADPSYKGPKVYTIGNDAGWEFVYTIKDTSYHNRNVRKTYWAGHPGIGKGTVKFEVKGDEGGNLRGTFGGLIYKATLDQDFLFNGKYDSSDYINFTTAEFYIPKK